MGMDPAPGAGDPPRLVRLSDYRPPDWTVEAARLDVDIRQRTRVRAEFDVERRAASLAPLRLDGRGLTPGDLTVDGRALATSDWVLDANGLVVHNLPPRCTLGMTTELDPDDNGSMEGWYRSGPMLCTQCEAHGFSRITFFPDRPDVLARIRVRMEADRTRYPVLLANGNRVESGVLHEGRHFVVWDDPHPKPCYLFAMVAGDLARVGDHFRTASGRDVTLSFYVDHGNEDRVTHAIASLKRAMRWDEETYGLEYDLEEYMVVAARDFNMGAMENKGLNLFNAAYVLASPGQATDDDYEGVESVIAHEYFHNWTGNRVTCRDWFQLSLKEGLTVFREQQYCASVGSPGLRRIREARQLRARQFPEDAGPMAHPVQPQAYEAVNNFYTATVYEKGAELIRMMETVLGTDTFVRGVQAYLQRHDGTAATIEDFVASLEEAGGRSLSGFRNWYAQAGTPRLSVTSKYDKKTERYTLVLKQETGPTPGQPDKRPVPIPIRFRLQSTTGGPMEMAAAAPELLRPDLIVLDSASATLQFEGVTAEPVPSLLRGFSAPVNIEQSLSPDQRAALLIGDDDAFVRWEAAQALMAAALFEAMDGAPGAARQRLCDALATLLVQPPEDPAMLAELLRLPSSAELLELRKPADPDAVVLAHGAVRLAVAAALTGPLSVFAQGGPEGSGQDAVGRRALAGLAQWYLVSIGAPSVLDLCERLAREASNLTLVMGALRALNDHACGQRERALDAFHERAGEEPLLLDKWFALQAAAAMSDPVGRLGALLERGDFDARNPNRLYATLGSFARANLGGFHAADGEGYRFYADQMLTIESRNPQVAARLVDPMLGWRRLAEPWSGLLRSELARMEGQAVSDDLGEKLRRALV